ncbi:MAG TPA: hypothetical protein DIV79_00530 [Opitutae bacterium]|nr:hypothetical protein [Opitutaceae bacterium]HCR28487.1 hypothetical protein [Opitutae bacterium]|tara:strand:+ start:451 stop:828 length:378 start_codon:yes stop_codon:yes gene_type:complete
MIYNVSLSDSDRRFAYVQVSPVEADLPEIAKKIVDFLKDDLKAVNEGTALEGGNLALGGNDNGEGESDSEPAAKDAGSKSVEGKADTERGEPKSVEETEPGSSDGSVSEEDSEEPEDEATKESGA